MGRETYSLYYAFDVKYLGHAAQWRWFDKVHIIQVICPGSYTTK